MAWAPWRSLVLLGFALVAPACLPAGGAQLRAPEMRRRGHAAEPLLSVVASSLRCAPHREAPALVRVEAGAPLRVVQQWFSPQGQCWLRVEASARDGRVARGWLQS